MKISLSWLLDHINCKSVSELDTDLEQLMLKFNQKVAEIEAFYFSNLNPNIFFIGKVTENVQDNIKFSVPELGKELLMPMRTDAEINQCFMLTQQEGKAFVWTSLVDLGLQKDGLVPALFVEEAELAGKWKNGIEWSDAILEVDNKSITHRPDMWGHRGFAREVALLCAKELLEAQGLLEKLPTTWAQVNEAQGLSAPGQISIKNETLDGCKYFCAAKFEQVDNKPSIPKMVFRLARAGIRPINAIVDLTNYLTADWGQPVHAYDAEKIPGGQLFIRQAKQGEILEMLDDKILELDKADMVIANAYGAIALAGIMGGKQDSISETTNNIIFESANFDATLVRQSAQRHKFRTESSARFEKTLHKNLALEGVLRFAALAKKFKIGMQLKGSIVCVGKNDDVVILTVQHNFLENKIGVTLRESDVIKPLEALGFQVEIDHSDEALCYKIKVPDFRASKDVKIPEDIVEEVARCFGFDKIEPKIPTFEKQPHDLSSRIKLHAAKNFLAYGAGMTEQCNYNFFNIDFINKINFIPEKTLSVKNPVSENTAKLVTSLIPGLLANIVKNYYQAEELAFFECGKIWKILSETEHAETGTIAGVFLKKRSAVNFFEYKELLQEMFRIFGFQLGDLVWTKIRNVKLPWQHPFATAKIEFQAKTIGTAGKINHNIWADLDFLPEADAFFFELDLDFLKNYAPGLIKAKPLPKTQEQSFDLAFMTNDAFTSVEFSAALKKIDKNIKTVILIDEFVKADWENKRSLTFRVKLQSLNDEPISRADVDKINNKAQETVFSMGAEIRG